MLKQLQNWYFGASFTTHMCRRLGEIQGSLSPWRRLGDEEKGGVDELRGDEYEEEEDLDNSEETGGRESIAVGQKDEEDFSGDEGGEEEEKEEVGNLEERQNEMDEKEETKVENGNDRKQEWELDENAVFTPLSDQVGGSQRIWAAISICWGGKFTLLTYLQL